MKMLMDNLNPGVFLAGLGFLSYGLWDISPHLMFIVLGSTLMLAVLADSAIRVALKLRRPK